MALAPTELIAAKEDIDGVMAAALDYIDGYINGDAERHARAYHPECIKRRYVTDEQSGVEELLVLCPRIMVDYAGLADMSDCETEVVIDAISEDIASVRIYSCNWVDFLHIVKARGEWKLFHVTWHGRSD
ncbi:MAG TPA: nuclear transport factor 2 family protein [Acidimicrobiia bacterium]